MGKSKIRAFFDRIFSHKWVVLIAWQVCSLFLCSIGTICSYLSIKYGCTIPLLMMSITYIILLCSSAWRVPKTDISWWRYLAVSVCAVSGDYTAILLSYLLPQLFFGLRHLHISFLVEK